MDMDKHTTESKPKFAKINLGETYLPQGTAPQCNLLNAYRQKACQWIKMTVKNISVRRIDATPFMYSDGTGHFFKNEQLPGPTKILICWNKYDDLPANSIPQRSFWKTMRTNRSYKLGFIPMYQKMPYTGFNIDDLASQYSKISDYQATFDCYRTSKTMYLYFLVSTDELLEEIEPPNQFQIYIDLDIKMTAKWRCYNYKQWELHKTNAVTAINAVNKGKRPRSQVSSLPVTAAEPAKARQSKPDARNRLPQTGRTTGRASAVARIQASAAECRRTDSCQQ